MTTSPDIERLLREMDEDNRSDKHNAMRGLVFGVLLALPFWAAVIYGVVKGVIR